MRSPVLILAVSFALGILGARVIPAAIPEFELATGLCLLLGLVALRGGRITLAQWLALAGFLAAGAAAAGLFPHRFSPDHIRHLSAWGFQLSHPLDLEGRMAGDPVDIPNGKQFDLNVERVMQGSRARPARGTVRLRTSGGQFQRDAAPFPRLRQGDLVRLAAQLYRPHSYKNPGSFDFRWWMESIEDLTWQGTVREVASVRRLRAASIRDSWSWGTRMRGRLLESIDGLYPPWSASGRDGAVLKAVLLGDRSSLDSETVESFRKSGLYHLLVVAGLHVGLLAMLLEVLLRVLRLGETRRAVVLLLFLVVYASVVEQRAPTLRATLMIGIYLLARLLYREHSALNAIGIAALILLLKRPAWLYESGFELSFSAALLIAGVVVPILEQTTEPYRQAFGRLDDVDLDAALAPRQAQFRLDVRSWIRFVGNRWKAFSNHPAWTKRLVTWPLRALVWAFNILLFSGILQAGLLLPMVEIFHRVTLAGIGLNALAIPLMTVVLAIATPVVLLNLVFPPLAAWPARLLPPILRTLFGLTEMPHLPAWLSYRVPGPPTWVAAGFALSIVVVAFALGRSRRMLAAGLVSFAVFALQVSTHPFAPAFLSGSLEITSLDCGGGQAVFVVFPRGRTLLVGACGESGRARWPASGPFRARRWDPGESIVSPYLWSRGVERIDFLVLPEAQDSALTGVATILNNFRVGGFGYGSLPPTPVSDALLGLLRRQGVRLRQLVAGDSFSTNGDRVEVLSPPFSAATAAPNSHSVVLRIMAGEDSILLAQNLEGGEEKSLAAGDASLASRLLIVSGRGFEKAAGTNFLAKVSPQLVLLSPPGRARHSRPSAETIEALRAAGAKVYRTNVEGAVTVVIHADRLDVHTYAHGSDANVSERLDRF